MDTTRYDNWVITYKHNIINKKLLVQFCKIPFGLMMVKYGYQRKLSTPIFINHMKHPKI
jgi:hypothetical protein